MDLQKKRADLCAHVEQLVGQINRTNGAIALLDDLLQEQAAEERQYVHRELSVQVPLVPESPSAAPDWVQGEVLEMPHALLPEEEVQS